jgi:hypothetical protein
MTDESPSEQGPPRATPEETRSATALALAHKVGPTEAALILLVLVAGPIIVELATSASPALYVFAAVVVLVIVAIYDLRRRDRVVPTPGLNEGDATAIVADLIAARDRVALRLQCPKSSCRANVFGRNLLGRLQIVRSLTVNMDRVCEWEISMLPGRGSTGIAWVTRKPHVTVAPFEGEEDLETEDAARVDPELQWIISVPLLIDSEPVWVVNVDGREARSRDAVEAAVDEVLSSIPALRPHAAKTVSG